MPDSTTTNATGTTLDLHVLEQHDIDYFTWVFGSPLIFFPGIIGNILTVIVMLRRAFQHTTTGVYLPLIALADVVVLVSGMLVDWLEWANVINFKEYNVWTCRVHKFVFYIAGDVSIWLIVSFTFDRFIAVCFPLSKRHVCVPRRAVYTSLIITLLFISKNIHEFWTRGLQYDKQGELKLVCGLPADYYAFHTYIRPWIAFIVILALPFTLILIFNCLIVHSLIQAQRMRAIATTTEQNTTSTYRQTTVMCLSVSFAFLICILPSIVLLIGKIYWDVPATRQAYKRAKTVNNIMVYVNHSINFILYCLTGRKFRDELRAMFKRNKTNKNTVSRGTATTNGNYHTTVTMDTKDNDLN